MRRTFLAALLCFALPAVAQMRVCMGGDLRHLSVSDKKACEDQMRIATDATTRSAHTHDLHVVVVCGEQSWKDYAAFAGRADASLDEATFDLDTATDTLFVRGARLTSSASVEAVLQQSTRQQGEGF